MKETKVEDYRIEKDSLGTRDIPGDVYYGVQSLRAAENFHITGLRMHPEIINSLAYIKKAAAITNCEVGMLEKRKAQAIVQACDEILAGKFREDFIVDPIQGGAGTSLNMNANEVISMLGNEYAKENILHPNDTVNASQSSNDTFPAALHIMVAQKINAELLPQLDLMINQIKKLEEENEGIIKIGRTHLQDATPLYFSQELSGYRSMIEHSKAQIIDSLKYVYELACGATAVGTGINCPEGFDEVVTKIISEKTHLPFVPDPNKFHALTSKDAMVYSSGALKGLASNCMKIANDIRWLASGPRSGIHEIDIPSNEPGSSIMPGKVNPTQCEALTMVAVQVMGNDTAIGIGASQGNFELNVFMPLIAYNMDQSIQLLSDAIHSFTIHCLDGLKANKETMDKNLHNSLMLVTCLNPVIGYEKAGHASQHAFKNNLTLKEAILDLGYLTSEEFDLYVQPEKMIHK